MRPFRRLFANLTKTASASMFQFLTVLLSTPLMTRLYSPDAYAVYGISSGIFALTIGIGLCSLPGALVKEQNPEQREALVRSILFMVFSLTLLSAIAVLVVSMIPALRTRIPLPLAVLLMIPLLVFTYGVRQLYVCLATAHGNFTRIAFTQIMEPVCSRGGSIVLGKLLGGEPLWILCSVACGHLSTIRMLFRHSRVAIFRRLREQWSSLACVRATLKRHRDYVLFNTASQQMFSLTALFYQSIIAAFCSTAHSGHYILATSVLVLPSTLIAMGSASAAYHHFSELVHSNPSALMRHLLVLMGLYFLGALCIFSPLYFWGEEIFIFAFGVTWEHAGTIASMLSVAQIGFFMIIGLQSVFVVTERIKLQFYVDLMFTLPTLLLAAYSFREMTFDAAITTLAVAWVVRHVVVLAACLWIAHHFSTRSVA